MKILWLTATPSKYKAEKFGYNGRGWIESLQTLIETSDKIDQLEIVFPHSTDSKKITADKVIYYPIKILTPRNIISWIFSNWINKVDNKEEIDILKARIEDFRPDVIHIFGSESWLCQAVSMTEIPCVVHLQGLLLPYINAFMPIGLSNYDLIKCNWIEFIKGISIWHYKRRFEKMSKREYIFFKDTTYFMGRTNWDKSISGFLSSRSTYFHIDEVLRDNFYDAPPWKYNKSNRTIITSTLSDNLNKGLDLVIKTATLLFKEGFEFEWRIIGINSNSKTVLLFKKKFKSDYSLLNINLVGVKKAEEIVSLLSDTTVYVHPSYIENSPNSLCEAQLMGVPVIATNVGGVSSLIEDTKDGFLVPANDPYFLASRIVQFSNNEVCLTNLSKRAREKAQKRHSKKDILNQLINVYNQCIADKLH